MRPDPLTLLALLGTGRVAANPDAPHPVLAEAWAALDCSNRETAALSALALTASARAAGKLSLAVAETHAPSPAETLPACPPAASLLLRRLLQGDHDELLPEWLALAARRGVRCLPRDLPALLDRAARDRSLRPAVSPVAGELGPWLARQNPAWGFLLENSAVPDEAWETGTAPERLAWLRQTRSADTHRAAESLAAAWAVDPGEIREKFLEIVAVSPTAHDLPLLEQHAVKDRRREIRSLARAALLRLPGSSLVHRAQTLAAQWLTIEGMLMTKRLVLKLPETFDPAWKADGIEEKPPSGTGPRAHWARQWLACVPLSFWPNHFGIELSKLLKLNRDEDSRETILLGWLDSATAAPEPAVAETFALELTAQNWPRQAPPPLEVFTSFFSVLASEPASRVLLTVQTAFPQIADELLFRSRFELSETAARRAVDRALAALQAKPYPQWQSPQARTLALRLPLAAAREAYVSLSRHPELSSPAEAFLRALEFRLKLNEALTA